MRIKMKPADWQLNPDHLDPKDERISFWSGGQMATMIDLATARKMIELGQAFVISGGAIGLLTDGRMDS